MSCKVIADQYPNIDDEKYTVLPGGDDTNPTWEEYVDGFNDFLKPRLQEIRKVIEETNMIGTYAADFCNDNCFLFDDGCIIAFSWRGWGDLMQAIVGKQEGYMKYYMDMRSCKL